MDIAALSTVLSQASLQQQASIKVMDKVMDESDTQTDSMVKMLEQSVSPHLGSTIDFKA